LAFGLGVGRRPVVVYFAWWLILFYLKRMTSPYDRIKHAMFVILPGSFAGIVANSICHPLDTVKTRVLQVNASVRRHVSRSGNLRKKVVFLLRIETENDEAIAIRRLAITGISHLRN
jgi:hypothetical protein